MAPSARCTAARTSRSIRPRFRHRERHPASDLQISIHSSLSRICVRSHRYWLPQTRSPCFRPIISGPTSYSCFSYPFLPGHVFRLFSFHCAPHYTPRLSMYRSCSTPPFPFPFCFRFGPVIFPRLVLILSHVLLSTPSPSVSFQTEQKRQQPSHSGSVKSGAYSVNYPRGRSIFKVRK